MLVGVKIRPMRKESGKRNRNVFPCNYCNKTVFEYARHLTQKHAHKKAVAAILLKPKKQRRKEFSELRKKAITEHNVDVLDNAEGELIVTRRNRLRQDMDDYLPCPSCGMLFSPKQLWRHHRQCNQMKTTGCGRFVKGSVVRQARLIMDIGASSSKLNTDFMRDVLSSLRRDVIYKTIKNDPLILQYGSNRYRNLGRYRSTEIAQNLRLLGRLLICINKHRDKPLTLMDCISGDYYEDVEDAVKEVCCCTTEATGRTVFEKPSIGTKLGHILLKCVKLKKRQAVKSKNKGMAEEASEFLSVYNSEWADSITSCALMSMKIKKLNGPEVLPKTSDLVKLKDHIDVKIKQLVVSLKKTYTYTEYRNLLEYTLAALILFNKRRGGEASKLLLEAYIGRKNWNETSNSDIVNSLTPVEKQLVQRLV